MSLLKALKLRSPGSSTGVAASSQKADKLRSAADNWRAVHRKADGQIQNLKVAIQAHYAQHDQKVQDEIAQGTKKLDAILNNVDHELAVLMADAGTSLEAADLEHARKLLTQYITYVASEPLIAQMDANPFGVTMGLKALLRDGLTDAAKAIG